MSTQPIRLAVSTCDHNQPLYVDCAHCLLLEAKQRVMRYAWFAHLAAEVLLLTACLLGIALILAYVNGWFDYAGMILAGVWI